MASLIKNQILKHLSKFTKNLSSDKISLSTLKGEGELSNLELDEQVLTELLDLPTWLNIKKATCNHVGIKIQWTKLKSQPIVLCLDEIIVEMETCETPREHPKTDNESHSSYRHHGKYGFIDRVIDGMFVRINSVLVKLVSKTFQASVELSRLTVQSMTPRWKPSENLRDSRVKDSEHDAILLFKEIEWQNTRIHASSVDIGPNDFSSPLRLIANQAKLRITLKKKIGDSSIIASRLQLYLDDLLWVFTKTQLKEAILYANSLSKIIENSSAQSKQRAAEKLQHQTHHTSKKAEEKAAQSLSPSHVPQPAPDKSGSLCYDVKSTSYHLFINPINLHLCDDTTNTTGNKDRLWNIEGGSMQITIYKFCMDFYPFHPAGSERDQWHNYETVGSRQSWVQSLFAEFKKDAVNIKSMAVNAQVNPTPNQRPAKPGSTARPPPPSPAKSKSTKLLESCCVVKVKDIAVYMVSTSSTKQSTLHKFLAADKQVPLPSDICTSLIHLQYTNYFFPEEMQYPVPDANLYAVLRPIRLTVDYTTLLWANYFFMDLSRNVDYDMLESEEPSEHMNIKVEAIMPRIIIPSEKKVVEQPERPEYVQLALSQVTATNVRIDERSSRNALQKLIDKYEKGDLFCTQSFPNGNKKFQIIPEALKNHAENNDNPYIQPEIKEILNKIDDKEQKPKTIKLDSNTLKRKAECDIWCFNIDTVCLDFLGIHNHKSRPVPFVEAFPMTVWLSGKTKSGGTHAEKESRPTKMKLKQYYSFEEEEQKHCDKKEIADNHVIADIGAKISLQINHYQYLFLLRLSESYAQFQSQLASDMILFANAEPTTFCIPLLVQAVEVAVISPYVAHLQMFTEQFDSPLHLSNKDGHLYSPDHHHVKIMAHKKQASNSAPNRISINTTDSTSSLEDNAHMMITKSMSESTIHVMPLETCDFTNDNEHISVTVEDYESVSHDTNFNTLPRKASSTNAIPTEVHHQEMHAASSFGGDSGVFMDNRSHMAKYSKQVKSAFSFLNDKIKSKLDDDTFSVDDDAMSIATDISEEDFVCLNLSEDQEYPVFHDKQSETASVTDTYSDDGSSVYAESCTTKPKESVYVTVFLLDDLQLLLHGNDKVSNIGLQLLSLSTCCYGNIYSDDIHLKLAGRGFFGNRERDEDKKDFPIKLEYLAEALPPHGSKPPSPERKVDKAGIKIQVKGVVLDLKLSSVTALTEFIEDELVPEIVPINVQVRDLLLILTEDRPTLNVGAPTPPPQNIHINKLLIEKELDGVFNLKALSSDRVSDELVPAGNDNDNDNDNDNAACSTSETSFKSSMILLQTENYKLTQKLAEMNRIRKDNEVLNMKISLTTSEFEKLRNENITLVDRVKSLSNKLSNTGTSTDKLEDENIQLHTRLSELEELFERNTTETESLQKTVTFLQNELQAAEKRYQKKMAEKKANDQT